MGAHSRPRPSAIDLLPEECEGVIAWAAQEMANTSRPQTDLYREFSDKLQAVKTEAKLAFEIPHYSSFTRHNMRLSATLARQRRADQLASAVVANTDSASADQLTRASTRLLKTLIVEMLERAGDKGFKPQEARNAASAVRELAQAELASTHGRQKVEEELAAKAKQAITAVAKAKGLTAETAEAILTQILGVEKS